MGAKKTDKTFLIFAIGAILLFMGKTIYDKIKLKIAGFLPPWEGFSAKPYWDHKQWSWGYGTKVPGSSTNAAINPGGTITREKAMQDALKHIQGDYDYLKPLVKVQLNPNQWTALLSFSYNLGRGNADNLMENINEQDLGALETQWKKYIYASGVINDQLVRRRAAEWNLYTS